MICHHTLENMLMSSIHKSMKNKHCYFQRLAIENAVIELERVIDKALEEKPPAYLTFPMDLQLPIRVHLSWRASARSKHDSVAEEREPGKTFQEHGRGMVWIPTITLKRFEAGA